MENVIPRRLFAEVAEEIHQVEWQKYKDCEGRVGEEVLQYVDLKNGIRFCDLFSKSLNSPERIYWIEKMNNCYADVGCVGDGGCDKSENEQCVILGGFGGRIAEHVQSNMAKKSIRKIFDVAKVSNNFESWLNIGRDVFFAAAAPKKLRV